MQFGLQGVEVCKKKKEKANFKFWTLQKNTKYANCIPPFCVKWNKVSQRRGTSPLSPMNTKATMKTVRTRTFIGHGLHGLCVAIKSDERDGPDTPRSLGKGVHLTGGVHRNENDPLPPLIPCCKCVCWAPAHTECRGQGAFDGPPGSPWPGERRPPLAAAVAEPRAYHCCPPPCPTTSNASNWGGGGLDKGTFSSHEETSEKVSSALEGDRWTQGGGTDCWGHCGRSNKPLRRPFPTLPGGHCRPTSIDFEPVLVKMAQNQSIAGKVKTIEGGAVRAKKKTTKITPKKSHSFTPGGSDTP